MKNLFLEEDISSISQYLKKYKKKIGGKSFLITGGSGFIGSYLVESLVHFSKSYGVNLKITSVDNNITSLERKTKSDKIVTYHKSDVSKNFNYHGKVDYILHAAGIASPVYYQKYPLETIDIAVAGTRNLLNLAKRNKVSAFMFFSSSEIYGNPPREMIPTSENYNGNVSSIGPRSCYDESKRLGETLSLVYFKLFKTPVKIVRPFNVFGPGMNYRDYRVIPTFIYKGVKNKKITIHSSGRQTRTFCYATDAIRAIFDVLFAGKNGEAYNVGNDSNEINMKKLAKMTARVIGGKPKIINIDYPNYYPEDEPLRRSPNLSKLRSLGYVPEISILEGLNKTVKWCKDNWNI